MDFTFTDDQLALRDSVSRFLMAEMAPEMLRELWETELGRSPSCCAKHRRAGPDRAVGARGPGRPGPGRHRLGADDPGAGLLRHARLAGRHRLRGASACWPRCLRRPCLRRPGCRQVVDGSCRIAVGHPGQPAGGRRAHGRPAAAVAPPAGHAGTARGAAPGGGVTCPAQHRRLAPPGTRRLDAAPPPGLPTARRHSPVGRALERGALAAAASWWAWRSACSICRSTTPRSASSSASRSAPSRRSSTTWPTWSRRIEFAARCSTAPPAALAAGRPASRRAGLARQAGLRRSRPGRLARKGIQVHGAMGYTWEVDLQMFMKRAWVLDAPGATAPSTRQRLADDPAQPRCAARRRPATLSPEEPDKHG
jgi:hypothetical protein